MNRLLTIALALTALVAASPVHAAEDLPRELEGVGVDERLAEQLDLSLEFTDHNGETVTLADYVRGDVPVVFTLNYYGCPMLCGLQLNALTDGLAEMDWAPGENFRVVTISFDPEETWELASAKRQSHLDALGRGDDVDWSFLVGTAENIEAVSQGFGYTYRYVEAQDEYAHPAAVMFVSPEGVINRYLYGLIYTPRDLKFAIMEASEGRVGTTVEQLILSCFVYDPEAGSYVQNAMTIMRLSGVATMIGIGIFLAVMWRRERSRPAMEPV